MMKFRRKREAGMTLLETTIGTMLMLISIGATFRVMQSTGEHTALTKKHSTLNQRANRALDRMVNILREAGLQTIDPAPLPALASSSFNFRRATGYNNGVITWGPPERLEMLPSPRDPVDGIDNDDNGLIDENIIVLLTNPGMPDEVRQVLATDIAPYLEGENPNGWDDNGNGIEDERGLSFELQESVLVIRMTMQAVGPGGTLLRRTVNTKVTCRN